VQKVAGSNPVRPTINSYGKSFYPIT